MCSVGFHKLETYNKETIKQAAVLIWSFSLRAFVFWSYSVCPIAVLMLSHWVLCIASQRSAFLQLFGHLIKIPECLGMNTIAPCILRLEFLSPACSQFHQLPLAQFPVTVSLSAHFFVNLCLQGPLCADSDTKMGMASNVTLDLIRAEWARKSARNFLSPLLIFPHATKSNYPKQTH